MTAKQEHKLDKELKDTFPASDPTSGNVFVGAPEEGDEDDARDVSDMSDSDLKGQTEKFSPDDAE
jgi:hypothetical protein